MIYNSMADKKCRKLRDEEVAKKRAKVGVEQSGLKSNPESGRSHIRALQHPAPPQIVAVNRWSYMMG